MNNLKKNLIVLFLLLSLSACSLNMPIYFGSEKNGFAISVERAIEISKPYLYKSFKLRNPSSVLTEKEYFAKRYYQVFVYLDQGYYLIFRDLPKKMESQHMASPVKVNIFTGEVVEPT